MKIQFYFDLKYDDFIDLNYVTKKINTMKLGIYKQ